MAAVLNSSDFIYQFEQWLTKQIIQQLSGL
ncbi:hypothetical protein CLV51_104122 [Chitinophaga niastensis]|uniref:Uncharacterized protein n=1 Tax=Chitinophaga niastensis TaxID=536980 RepID=A0A2P8HGV1_CHINA|nr:hypothetical protein CLV51_104122 [Chitinophaga niastensis]